MLLIQILTLAVVSVRLGKKRQTKGYDITHYVISHASVHKYSTVVQHEELAASNGKATVIIHILPRSASALCRNMTVSACLAFITLHHGYSPGR